MIRIYLKTSELQAYIDAIEYQFVHDDDLRASFMLVWKSVDGKGYVIPLDQIAYIAYDNPEKLKDDFKKE